MNFLIAFLIVLIVELSTSQIWPQSARRGGWRESPKKKSPQRISVLKCKEYKKFVERRFLFGPAPDESEEDDPYTMIDYDCDAFTGLIVGGQVTDPGEFPHMAAIGWRFPNRSVTFNCGGSLISERFVLSVAHCTEVDNEPPKFVRLGDQNLASLDDGAEPDDFEISKIIIHEKYNPLRKIHDIALFKLAKDVVISNFIRPACLSQDKSYNEGVIATGWGKTGTYRSTSDQLLKVALNVVDSQTCYSRLGSEISASSILPGQICAAGERRKDTCQGDSGGPIQVSHLKASCVYDIIGLTSYGTARCGSSVPSIYTRVYYYLDWIERNVWG